MDAFTNTVNAAIKASLNTTIKDYISEFAKELITKIKSHKDKEWKTDEIINLWNKHANEFTIKKGGNKKEVDPDAPQCEYVYTKGDHNGDQCEGKVSQKSETGKFCVKHYKQKESGKASKKKEKATTGKKCKHINKKGDYLDEECGKNVSTKSKTGDYCSKHLSDEKKSKIDKTDFIRFLKNHLKGIDLDAEELDVEAITDIIKEVEKKKEFGFMALYNMKKLAPKIYEKIGTVTDEYVTENAKDHEKEIKEQEDEEAEIEKKKKGKSKKGKKEKDDESEDEDETEDNEDDKSSKSKKEDKSKKSSKKPNKTSKKKDEEVNKEDEEEVKEEKPDEEMEEGDEVVEKQKIVAKRVKSGSLKGKAYIKDAKTSTDYLLDSENQSVYGKIVDGKKAELTDKDKEYLGKAYPDLDIIEE